MLIQALRKHPFRVILTTMTLSSGRSRVLYKTRYMAWLKNRIGIPHGTDHPNQLVDHVIGDEFRGFTLGQFTRFVPTIFLVMRPG